MTPVDRRISCPYIATDAIIRYSNGKSEGIVFIERKNQPYGLALPGGFAEYGLTLEENVRKEAKEETNLEFDIENPEHPLCVHSQPNRDPRAHIISVFYIGRGEGLLQAGDDAAKARVYGIDEVIDILGKRIFAFRSHERAITEYLTREGYLGKTEVTR
ncbi:MAG: NUDIX hydrolase [Nanoarchaeota archaeon]